MRRWISAINESFTVAESIVEAAVDECMSQIDAYSEEDMLRASHRT
jgi:hypothetical protein